MLAEWACAVHDTSVGDLDGEIVFGAFEAAFVYAFEHRNDLEHDEIIYTG